MTLQVERDRLRIQLAQYEAAIEELLYLLQSDTRRIELKADPLKADPPYEVDNV